MITVSLPLYLGVLPERVRGDIDLSEDVDGDKFYVLIDGSYLPPTRPTREYPGDPAGFHVEDMYFEHSKNGVPESLKWHIIESDQIWRNVLQIAAEKAYE